MKTTTTTLAPVTALQEMGRFLRSWLFDCRARRDFRSVLEVESLQDVENDLRLDLRGLSASAFTARVADDEALALLEKITAPASAGGTRITDGEAADLFRAMQHIRRSAALDHEITERLDAQCSL